MGLDMKTKKKLSEETAKRYCTAAKKQKRTLYLHPYPYRCSFRLDRKPSPFKQSSSMGKRSNRRGMREAALSDERY